MDNIWLKVNSCFKSHPMLNNSFLCVASMPLDEYNSAEDGADHYVSLDRGDWISPSVWHNEKGWTIGGIEDGWTEATVLHHATSKIEKGWISAEFAQLCLSRNKMSTYFALELGRPAIDVGPWSSAHHVSLAYTRPLDNATIERARRRGKVIIEKFGIDHYLPLYDTRPRLCTDTRTGAKFWAGSCSYRSRHIGVG